MRKLNRPEAPACLTEQAEAATTNFLTARELDPAARFDWPGGDCYKVIRTRLLEMTQQHCAFCDGPFAESRETVEHFRPKSRFPALAYAWDNLFPCCDACQSAKGEKFDEALLKPDDDGYRFADYFIVNYLDGRIEPLPSAPTDRQVRADVSIRLYDLNKPARKLARKREWESFRGAGQPCIDDFNYRFFLE